ncbi:MAG TPA: hypothetical protein IAC79_03075 [Candidatus Spyradenecus faecavium]|uniref:HTH HARE-type domain-containing protein n=1 Tax=Candidatus Spyradenecus faecavium TaxID=2840947 RepID=A0A9D1NMG1_9BACT|nr:hypothetical protein [Candidatus Spyradenecus faecavium]
MNDLPLNAPVLVRIGATVCHGTLCQRNARGNCLIRFGGSNSERWVKATCVSLAPQRVYTGLLAIALDLLRQSEIPRTAGDLIRAILAQGLWSPRTGKTPRLTLYGMLYTASHQPVPPVRRLPNGLWELL